MNSYSIPIHFLPFEKQRKAARLLHLLAGFLLMLNAYGDFKQNTPDTVFLILQIASALLVLVFAAAGKSMIRNEARGNSWFRLLETAMFFYAARYFFTLNLTLPAMMQIIAAMGLLLLYFSERKIFAPVAVIIGDEGIFLPDNFKDKKIEWAKVSNMVLKSDFISIDTTGNHFLQYEVSEVLSDERIDEINAFCRSRFTAKA